MSRWDGGRGGRRGGAIGSWCTLAIVHFAQAKCSDLDDRLLTLSKDQQALIQKIAVLQLNADKLDPNKKVVTKETVRYVDEHVRACTQSFA